VNFTDLAAISKDQIPLRAKTLSAEDVEFLVENLSEKDDKLRYNAFLLLQAHSALAPSVYAYWDVLAKKLDNDNSYQRSLGVMLMAENIHWDTEGKFAASISKYLGCCSDEKFITARQTIQALTKVVGITKAYNKTIANNLSTLDISKYKDNQQSLLKKDIAALQKKL
jgi:hypothetical protein